MRRSVTPATLGAFIAVVALVLGSGMALAAPAVQDLVSLVDAGSYQTYQIAVESMGLGLYDAEYDMGVRNRDGTPGPGTLGNQECRLYLSDTFSAMGLSVSIQGSYSNVVGELRGVVTPQRIYIVSGHYDHVGGATGDRPGGDDNASGTAGVLEAARVLTDYAFESTIRFIGFNAEEDGLLGSKDYVNNHVIPNGQNIVGVINLDMILRPAHDDDPNAVIDLDLGTRTSKGASVAWAQTFAAVAGAYVPSLPIDETIFNVSGGSDQDPFAVNDFPAFLAIENTADEIWGGANDYYHTYNDASDRLANDPDSPSGVAYDYDFATDVARAVVATIAQEAVVVGRIGDADLDGVVGDDDLSMVLASLAQGGTDWHHGNFNADGFTDGDDLTLLLDHFGEGSPEEAVPEPATLSYMILAACGAYVTRKRTRARNAESEARKARR